ncbi:hypothetical protein [Tahibacter caeni]|uniref:hypothetical protein n=1 Tax=Tahibacter caeni TaxID=1453545 RepID=UPI00214948FA|nr:hypothetical protein [Tahibacter caeni]
MKRLALLLLTLLPLAASAESVLLGRDLVGKGDAAAPIRAAAGEPSRLDRIDGDEYSPPMEIWTYRFTDKVVSLWIVDGKVVQATEERVVAGGSGGSAQVREAH